MVSIVFFTAANEEEAKKIVERLLEEKLVACANMFPVKSAYWWEDKLESSVEIFVWMKTRADKFERIVERIKELHSYELPVVEMIDSKTFPDVEQWIESCVKEK